MHYNPRQKRSWKKTNFGHGFSLNDFHKILRGWGFQQVFATCVATLTATWGHTFDRESSPGNPRGPLPPCAPDTLDFAQCIWAPNGSGLQNEHDFFSNRWWLGSSRSFPRFFFPTNLLLQGRPGHPKKSRNSSSMELELPSICCTLHLQLAQPKGPFCQLEWLATPLLAV